MLAATASLCSDVPISMKVAATAGQPRLQKVGVCQSCPLNPMLCGLFFHELHHHLQLLQLYAPMSGIQSRSG